MSTATEGVTVKKASQGQANCSPFTTSLKWDSMFAPLLLLSLARQEKLRTVAFCVPMLYEVNVQWLQEPHHHQVPRINWPFHWLLQLCILRLLRKFQQSSNFLDNIQPGQRIIPDRGFTAWDLITRKEAFLTIPSFLWSSSKLIGHGNSDYS